MAGRGWRRWQKQIVGGITLVTLILLAILAFEAYRSYRDAATALVLDRNRENAYLSAIRLRDELTRFSNDLRATSRTSDMTLGLVTRQRTALHEASRRLAIFDGGVILLDGFGKVRSAEPPRPELLSQDWSDRPFFRALLTSTEPNYASASGIGPDGSNVVVVTVPILGENGELVGALCGMFRLGQPTVSSFYAGIVRLRIKASGSTYVVDSSGRILFDSDFVRVGQFVTLPWGSSSTLQGGALRTVDADNNQIILAYAPVPGTDWSLLVEDDWALASAPIRRYAGGLAALLVVGMLLPVAAIIALLRSQHAAAVVEEASEQETRLAVLMRDRLLPKQPPLLSGYNLAVRTLPPPAGRTPGDFYDLMLLLDGKLVITLGTVDEQGVLATHVMAMARAAFRAASCKDSTPAQALAQCNLLLCPEVDADSSVASIFAVLDPRTGRLQYSTAGQPAPLRWYGSVLSELGPEPHGSVLGRDLNARYSQDEAYLTPGEAVVFYSRGFRDLRGAGGEPFGLDQMVAALNAAPALNAATGEADSLADSLETAVRSFLDDRPAPADLTFVLLVREPRPVGETSPRREQPPIFATLAGTETDL